MLEIFLDIETIPTSRADIRARCVADVAPPGNYKKPESIEQWWASEGNAKKQEAIARTALDGTWGEIICIGVAVNDAPAIVFLRDRTSSELELIEEFGEQLSKWCERESHGAEMWPVIAKWIGHNIQDFDLRFLWQRQKLLGAKLPFLLPVDRNNHHVYDTMKEWAGWKERVSQKDLELAFGLTRVDPLPEGGANVCQAYQEDRLADIVTHCQQDIERLRELYRRMAA